MVPCYSVVFPMWLVVVNIFTEAQNNFLCIDADHNPHHLCLLSYRMPSNFTPIVAPHGNSKTKKPFFPTLPSTKLEIESQSKSSGPKTTLSLVSEKLGGVVDADSPCELPRNERQVSYIKSKSTSSNVLLADQVFAIMQSAKQEDVIGKFVRETRPSPEPAFVLARDRQLDDLVRFCTVADDFSILTVDPTFKVVPSSLNQLKPRGN